MTKPNKKPHESRKQKHKPNDNKQNQTTEAKKECSCKAAEAKKDGPSTSSEAKQTSETKESPAETKGTLVETKGAPEEIKGGPEEIKEVPAKTNENVEAKEMHLEAVSPPSECKSSNNNAPLCKMEHIADEDEDTFIESRPVFTANACHMCKSIHEGDVQLKTCSGCHLISYCSGTHQKEHWKEHKQFCNVVKQLLKSESISHVYERCEGLNDEMWRVVRFEAIVKIEGKMDRRMTAYEREMILFPRACVTCHKVVGTILTCMGCHYVNYCSSGHLPDEHWCSQLRLWLDFTKYQHENGLVDPPLPSKCSSKYEELPLSGCRELFVTKLIGPSKTMSMGNVLFNSLTEQASYPLTVVYVLQEIFREICPTHNTSCIEDVDSIVIHIVGAELEFEGDAMTKWDVFTFHLLPKLMKLKIIFIGPEISSFPIPTGSYNEDFLCPNCRDVRDMQIEFYGNTLYHDYCKSDNYCKPDIICAFNVGLYRRNGFKGVDSWKESIPFMVQENVPLLITGYVKCETVLDVERIEKDVEKVQVLVPPQKNPYRSLRPLRNLVAEDNCPLMYRNQFYSVICASSIAGKK